ncbi:hypothetical protein ACIQVO_25305 [Streptomyces sp. NPDC101062]|uniref:hypothetical protein n=1 Tax=unclassified Streptomyces TaxID=2593676 RepID=UPI002E763895|nr:hypothetical protein [Streptomyces sp. JV176]MEE1803817.1 hypothetical protein [Streptomyces sp. JV176]
MAIIPVDLLDRIRTLERQVRDLMGSANTRPAMNQILGGDVVIGDGGRLRVRTGQGDDLLYLGRVQPDRAEGAPQQGLMVRRDDGSLALTVWTGTPDTLPVQPVQILDRKGNVVVADDAVGHGLARPYVPYPLPQPVAADRWESTGATDWATLYRGTGIAQHARLYCRIAAESAGRAELRLTADGVQVGPAGDARGLEFTAVLDVAYDATVTFEVQARVLAAGDTVRCRPLALYGVQS